MNDMPPPETCPAGIDAPGTPAAFPFELVSNGLTAVAVMAMLVTIVTETSGWFPFEFWGLPGLYWLAVAAALVTGIMALVRKPWRGARSAAGILVWLFVLTPFFPGAAVLLLLAMKN